MNKFRNFLLAAGFALTSALGCDYYKELAERSLAAQAEQPQTDDDKSIDSLLEFYVKGDQELKKLKESGVEADSRQKALEQAGYEINPNALAYQHLKPQLPEPMNVTCHYGNFESGTIGVEVDNERLSIRDSINYGGWGGVTFVTHHTLNAGEDPLDWQWSWDFLRDDLQSNEIKERQGSGFDGLCKHQHSARYRRLSNSSAFYCVHSTEGDSQSNQGKYAMAAVFLEGVEEMICGE